MGRIGWPDMATLARPGARILVVDDNPDIRKALVRLLSHGGYAPQVAESAEAAELWLQRQRFELCLLDIELPRMSGVELLRWCMVRDREMAAIMLTGLDSPDLALECMDHGARTFLVKPIEADFLLRAVRDALAVRSLLVYHNDTEGRHNTG